MTWPGTAYPLGATSFLMLGTDGEPTGVELGAGETVKVASHSILVLDSRS